MLDSVYTICYAMHLNNYVNWFCNYWQHSLKVFSVPAPLRISRLSSFSRLSQTGHTVHSTLILDTDSTCLRDRH